MFDELPEKDSFMVYPVKNGGRWVTNRRYLIWLPVKMLNLTDLHMPPGEYEYYKKPNKEGKLRQLVEEEPYDLSVIFPPELGEAAEANGGGKQEIEDTDGKKKKVEVVKFKTNGKTKVKGDGIYVRKSHCDLIEKIHPGAKPYTDGERLNPVFYVDPSAKNGAPFDIVAAVMPFKYWD